MTGRMRVATWNVNGLRARLEFLVRWLRDRRPDLVGLQELKLTEDQFPHALLATEGYRVPAGEIYSAVESPRGELGFYIISDGSARPYRIHVRAPSFANMQALAVIIKGSLVSDLVATIGSLDPVMGEVDR